MTDEYKILMDLFYAALLAADPKTALAKVIPKDSSLPVIVVGAGKASAHMAREFEDLWTGPISGSVVTQYGCGVDCQKIRVMEAGHPIPDENGLAASREMIGLVSGLGEDDLVVALISGGGSALLPMPPPGFTLADEIELNTALLRSGAPISAMNAVRKQFSMIKGGRLAVAARPAQVVTYAISDVPGDDPAEIASGPTVLDEAAAGDVLAILDAYRVPVSDAVRKHFSSQSVSSVPNENDASRSEINIIASSQTSLSFAAARASDMGLPAVILSDAIEGEAREVGRVLAAISKEVLVHDRPFGKPIVILSGGETTVTLRGEGRGGRNSELMLAFALSIDGCPRISALAADTDGIDGTGPNAGAFVNGETASRIRRAGADPLALLGDNDSLSGFEMVGDVFSTGPTGTNVNDFRAILVR